MSVSSSRHSVPAWRASRMKPAERAPASVAVSSSEDTMTDSTSGTEHGGDRMKPKRNLGRPRLCSRSSADPSHTDDIVRGISKADPQTPHCSSSGLPVRDARARRTAIGARHHAARRVVRGRHARHPHEGGTLRRDRQSTGGFFFVWRSGRSAARGFTFILSARGLWSLRRGQPK